MFDDDCLQREAELAGPSSTVSWEEDRGQQLQTSNEMSQPIYDTDGESYESIVIDEDSLNLHFFPSQTINSNGDQQPFISKDEEENEEDIFEQAEIKGPSLEKEEVKEHTPAQE